MSFVRWKLDNRRVTQQRSTFLIWRHLVMPKPQRLAEFGFGLSNGNTDLSGLR
jgi:hypothetical protein